MSRGRRDVLRSLTTLLVLGSMTMRLLVFSLLTNTRPVSLAHPTEHSAAANMTIESVADNRHGMGTDDPLLLAKTINPSVRLIQAAGQAPHPASGSAGVPPASSKERAGETPALPAAGWGRRRQCSSAAKGEVTG